MVDFVDAPSSEVNVVVIAAIQNASITGVAFITNLHSRFQEMLNTLSTENQEVFQLNAEEQTATVRYQICHQSLGDEVSEEHECIEKCECEMTAVRLCIEWVREEAELRQVHASINGHFCPLGSNGALHSFRVASVPC